MKFKINRDHFSNGLAQVLNVVGSKAAMPILSNVLIEAEKDHISLTTTNLDLGIRFRMLQPHELAAAQGFARSYKFEGNKSTQVKQIGNAVPHYTAKALCRERLKQYVSHGANLT